VGTKRVRAQIETQYKEGKLDEYGKLFYEAFIAKNESTFQEHFVAIGKSKPTLSILTQGGGKFQFKNVRWTLPYTTKDKNGQEVTYDLLNSTCEKVFYMHQDLIYDKRCIVALDGYYEYYHLNKETYPYYIYPGQGVFYAGGIWKPVLDEKTGEITDCLSIITTPPNPMVRKIHNNPKAPNGSRMLLFVPPERVIEYLDPSLKQNQIKTFFQPYPEQGMQAHPVVRFQRKEFYQYANSPKVQQQYVYPELVT
jgi:Uncharacterized conserved protein